MTTCRVPSCPYTGEHHHDLFNENIVRDWRGSRICICTHDPQKCLVGFGFKGEHICICKKDPRRCKAGSYRQRHWHECICDLDSSECRSTRHPCICTRKPEECRAKANHPCICSVDSDKCKSRTHVCTCDLNSHKCIECRADFELPDLFWVAPSRAISIWPWSLVRGNGIASNPTPWSKDDTWLEHTANRRSG